MVLLSCLCVSKAITSYEREKNECLDSFIELIKYIRNRIDCYSMPIDKIFYECPDEKLDPFGGKRDGMIFSDLLNGKENLVRGESRRILEEFSETLGKNYRDRQVKLCDRAVSALESIRDAEIKRSSVHKKIVNTLCLAAGGIIIILLF